MGENKKCSCGGEMTDRGRKFINISDTRIAANSILSFEPVQMYVCGVCGKMEFYALNESTGSGEKSFGESLYDRYSGLPTAKLEKILESNSYTEECKTVVRRILSER